TDISRSWSSRRLSSRKCCAISLQCPIASAFVLNSIPTVSLWGTPSFISKKNFCMLLPLATPIRCARIGSENAGRVPRPRQRRHHHHVSADKKLNQSSSEGEIETGGKVCGAIGASFGA